MDNAFVRNLSRFWKRARHFVQVLALSWECIRYVYACTPFLATIVFLCETATTLFPLAILWLTKRTMDLLFSRGDVRPPDAGSQLLFLMVLYALVMMVHQVISDLKVHLDTAQQEKLAAESEISLFKKTNEFKDLAYFEIPEFHNQLRNAQAGCGPRFLSVMNMLRGIFSGLLMLTAASALFARIEWYVGLVIILGILPNTAFVFWSAGNRVWLFHYLAENSRFLTYFRWILTEPSMAKEIRLLDAGDFFIKKYRDRFAREYSRRQEFRRKTAVVGAITGTISAGTSAGIFVWICYKAYLRQILIGDAVLYMGLLPMVPMSLMRILNCVVFTYENNLYVKQFFDFMKIPPSLPELPEAQRVKVTLPFRTGFELRNVSFAYPGASRLVLHDLSLFLPAGQTVAIVGRNGSGKTTLVKLLLRLYDPTRGEILLNGVPLPHYDVGALRSKQAAVFQDFAQFYMTAEENIALGNVRRPIDRQWIADAAARAQIQTFLESLPQGYDTMLGKQFDGGVDLSGGQWQRVALARAFARDAGIIVLDEPTSAMDAEAEHELYRHFKELLGDRMGILVSHRFSSIRMADRVVVLDEGRLVEQGTHGELMRADGLYALLFNMQAEAFILTEA